MAKANPVKWTREHFLIALNLYCKLPFGKLDQRNPIIKEVSAKMGRTPSSLAMKLSNFASLDPVQQAPLAPPATRASQLRLACAGVCSQPLSGETVGGEICGGFVATHDHRACEKSLLTNHRLQPIDTEATIV